MKDKIAKKLGRSGDNDGDGYDGEPVSGDVDYAEWHHLIEAIAEMLLYSRLLEDKFEDVDGVEGEASLDVAKDVSSNNIEMIGLFEVQEMCERKGIDFEEDVLNELPERV